MSRHYNYGDDYSDDYSDYHRGNIYSQATPGPGVGRNYQTSGGYNAAAGGPSSNATTNGYGSYKPGGPVHVKKTPVIRISDEAKRLMDYLIKGTSLECSGLGIVERDGDDFVITKLIFPKQRNTAGHTALDMEDVFRILFDMEEKEEGSMAKVRLWWHSHNSMNVFWSAEDEGTAAALVNNAEWMLCIVGNHRGEYLCRLDMNQPFRTVFDNIPLKVDPPVEASADPLVAVAKELLAKNTEHRHGTHDWQKGRPETPSSYGRGSSYPNSGNTSGAGGGTHGNSYASGVGRGTPPTAGELTEYVEIPLVAAVDWKDFDWNLAEPLPGQPAGNPVVAAGPGTETQGQTQTQAQVTERLTYCITSKPGCLDRGKTELLDELKALGFEPSLINYTEQWVSGSLEKARLMEVASLDSVHQIRPYIWTSSASKGEAVALDTPAAGEESPATTDEPVTSAEATPEASSETAAETVAEGNLEPVLSA